MNTKMDEKKYRYHIMTLGCQMNKSDSERMATILENMGLAHTKNIKKADVILMNSCSVRQQAEDRIIGRSKNFQKLKEKKPDLIVGVTGCMPGRDKSGSMEGRLHDVDLYFPTKDMVHLPKWLSELNPDLRPMEDMKEDYLALKPTYDKKTQAFVTIQTGCNHFCTYCVVPFSRGLEVNRAAADILSEIRGLADEGCLEVTLLGQIVNHYIAPDSETFSKSNPYKESDFAKLLWEINRIDGIERIHFTAPHPLYMTDEVIDALSLPKQLNYLHLPVQCGNNEMLKKMNRRHTREFFIDLIDKIRAKNPTIAIGTDIIVGFCGETEEMFNETIDLYRQADFDISYNAQYSVRSGTVAWRAWEDDVPKEEKKRRWWLLQDLMEARTREKNEAYIGKTVSVLVEKCERGWCIGNSREMKLVRFRGESSHVGTILSVHIDKADTWLLWGTPVDL